MISCRYSVPSVCRRTWIIARFHGVGITDFPIKAVSSYFAATGILAKLLCHFLSESLTYCGSTDALGIVLFDDPLILFTTSILDYMIVWHVMYW